MEGILEMAGMCLRLVTSGRLDVSNDSQMSLFDEYKQIIIRKDLNHQLIRGIAHKNYILGCIDPRYRGGKPLKFQLYTRETILVMYNVFTKTNVIVNYIPEIVDCRMFPLNNSTGGRPRREKFELLPKEATQCHHWQFVHRPAIEFNFTDTFSPLYQHIKAMANAFNTENVTNHDQQQAQ